MVLCSNNNNTALIYSQTWSKDHLLIKTAFYFYAIEHAYKEHLYIIPHFIGPWGGLYIQVSLYLYSDNADCDNLARSGKAYLDGVYTLRVGHHDPFPAFCNMTSEGWTVIQQRAVGSEDFNRSWNDYKHGFGSLGESSDFWMGLQRIYWLTNQRSYVVH